MFHTNLACFFPLNVGTPYATPNNHPLPLRGEVSQRLSDWLSVAVEVWGRLGKGSGAVEEAVRRSVPLGGQEAQHLHKGQPQVPEPWIH